MAVATKKLHELAEVFSGYAFKSKDLGKEGLPVVKIKNVNNKIVSKQCDQFLPNNLVTERLKKYLLQKEDILVAMTGQGSLGRIGKMINQKGQYIVNQRVGIVRSKVEDDSLAEYLFSVLALDEFEQQLYSLGAGAGQPNVSAVDIRNLDIPYPAKSLRKFIAKTRANYDNLIENNNRRIAILEDMAQSLYREWFVNFRYPNHEDNLDADGKPKLIDSPLGQIPEGWEVKKFSDVVNYKTGRLNSNAAVAGGEYPFFTCSRETFRTNTWSFDCECVLLAGNNANAIYPIKYFNGKFDAYQRTYVITEKNRDELTPSFLFYCLEIKLNQLKNISTGTSTRFLTKGILDNLDLLIPAPELMSQFNLIVLSLLNSQGNLRKRNENIKQQRDMLLPKLISGQIGLKD